MQGVVCRCTFSSGKLLERVSKFANAVHFQRRCVRHGSLLSRPPFLRASETPLGERFSSRHIARNPVEQKCGFSEKDVKALFSHQHLTAVILGGVCLPPSLFKGALADAGTEVFLKCWGWLRGGFVERCTVWKCKCLESPCVAVLSPVARSPAEHS